MDNLVIFIHGALSSKTSWAFHKSQLSLELQKSEVYDFSYDIERETSESVVQRLVNEINLLGVFKTISLIGHSFGGVIAIDAVRLLKEHNKNTKFKVMTISAPLGGSGHASLMRIAKPFSLFLKNVGSYEQFMSAFKRNSLPCRVDSIISLSKLSPDQIICDSDGVVTLHSQVHFKNDPFSKLYYIESNHFEVLLSKDVNNQIKFFLD